MIIKSLELKNYRNYDELSMNFASGTNLLYGDNAQGKTNILESIYLSATTKSHRGNKDRELIKFEENEAHIRIHFEKQGIDHQLDMHLKKNKAKGVAIDRIPIRRSSDLLGQIPVILFSPEDLKIVKSGPSERRKFLDIELSQMERLYLYQLTNYNKILVQRNNLLKQIRFQNNLIETLEAWDIQLVKYGSEVIKYREKFIKHLGEVCQKIHNKLTGGKEKILLEYDRDVGYDSYLTELAKKRQKDLKYSTTTVGPHRDDISFIVNGIDIRKYGSQGQQRTAALSLKLAQIQLMREVMKEYEFVLWVIGAKAEDRGKFVYDLPDNVVEVHEVFLDDALRLSGERAQVSFTEEELRSLRELVNLGSPDWDVLFNLFHTRGVHPLSFLQSREFIDLFTQICMEEYPYVAYADAFHTVRSMLLPVLYLMGCEVPEAQIYHAISTGYGGLLACWGGYQPCAGIAYGTWHLYA